MLDIKFIRENKDLVEMAIKNKKSKPVDLGELLAVYEEKKRLNKELDELNQKRNMAAQNRAVEEGTSLKKEVALVEEVLAGIEKKFMSLMILLPNIPSADTPIGADESGNKVVRQVGEKPVFNFKPKEHWELGVELDLIDTERAGNISGPRFAYLKGDLALMQFALLNFALGVLTNEDTLEKIKNDAGLNISTKPFIPVIPPVFIKPAVMNRMARLEPREERYHTEADDLYLVGSAEHTLGPIHMDEVIPVEKLPIRYAGYSTAFRREAGAAGKDTRGILRMHQFDKLEMEGFCLPENSYQEQEFFVAIQEYLMCSLGLPYQVMLICTGDMGGPDHRQFDIETWMPGQNKYRETQTSDLMTSYQSRRLNTRFKKKDEKPDFVHMNDATALAIGRTLIAIMENYQQADGSIKVPEVLQKYMGKSVICQQ
ncbi:MAG: serine--tRNA ligase [Candidatus Taylorbacteria bacterium RIFOXYD2_FULL_36_9]|uniref:Serine--tRNA ligase n=1 Tax=Candidatus Taylorbacteria bacterium RIFOXYD2_FULL_36_9 TaxID=1802338 RepID=A0A1G2PCY7_9BACT|nr:MAG: serine--tRNA ligase [Candidatus Taylorbacteria bacterium RIFOXYD2_FULL_36_9]